jgi:hydroxymethylglutaryl-CoA lyase
MLFAHAPERVYVNEVAVRDGFQSEPSFVPTDRKIDIINRLARTGLAKIEVTAFVSPRAIPNLRDAEEVMRGIERRPGARSTKCPTPSRLRIPKCRSRCTSTTHVSWDSRM